jgi:hypothetical protein
MINLILSITFPISEINNNNLYSKGEDTNDFENITETHHTISSSGVNTPPSKFINIFAATMTSSTSGSDVSRSGIDVTV